MGMRIRRAVGSVALAIALTLVSGVAVAAAANVPVVVGAVHNPASGLYEDSLSGPVAVATQDTPAGWYAYAPAAYNSDLTAISMSDPTNPTIVGEGVPGDGGTQLYGASTVNIFNGIAYVVSKNLNGPCTGAFQSPPNLTGCSNNYAPNGTQYGNALTLFDVSTNPAAPKYLGRISDASTGGNSLFGAYGITVTTIGGSRYAVVAAQGCIGGQPCPSGSGGDDLDMINVDTPTSPQLIGTAFNSTAAGFLHNDLKHATAVAVSGNYAYVTAFSGSALTVVDISNPRSPTAVAWIQSTADLPLPSDVAIQGNYAYVINQDSAGGQGTLTVVDISNPLSPTIVGSVRAIGLKAGYRIRVAGNMAYVAARGSNAITTVDVTIPAAPVVITSDVNPADLNATTGLDLMNIAGNQYVVASSPYLSSESNYSYPSYPSFGNTVQTNTGTISALELEDPPVNTAPPTVTGSTLAGRTLTAHVGAWSGTAPFTYAYQWQRCDTHGANCIVLRTPTPTYPLGNTDLGHTIRVVVKAANGAGSATATSATTAVVTVCPARGRGPAYCAKPKVRHRPTVTGTTKVGQLLVANTGSWAKLPPSAYNSSQYPTTKVQWLRCDTHGAHCKAIAHATHVNYRPTGRDMRRRLKLQVIAKNTNGTARASSAPSAPIASSRTRIDLTLSVPRQPQIVKKGYVIARVRSNVGALLDMFVAIQVGHTGANWITGTAAEAAPGVPLMFKLHLTASERRDLRSALSSHVRITAEVIGARFISPGHSGFQQTAPQHIVITG